MDLKKRFAEERKETVTLTNTVVINRPIQEVFDAVSTSHLWTLCYPETISTGGITKRPFKKGDLILERFMFAGEIFSCFQYEVDVYEPPRALSFHGIQLMTRHSLEKKLGSLIDTIGGTFEYKLEEQDSNTTHWTRMVHFYYTGGWKSKLAFNKYMRIVLDSQKKGAAIFVQNVKRFLETDGYERDLYFYGSS